MESIGLFEAKTKLSEICDRVMKQKQPVIITKRGKPIALIAPVEEDKKGIWDLAGKYKKTNGPIKDNFKLPPRRIERGEKHLD